MDKLKFSVLMSVYQKEEPEFLATALKSNLTDQTRLPDEMILVCDGPLTEKLDEVIRQFADQYPDVLKVFRLPENGGLGKALNYGLEQCGCEWVARSDSDDICDSRRFEVQLNYLQEHPEIDILGTCIDEFDVDWERPLRRKHMPLLHAEIAKMAKSRNPINHMTVMFRKSAVLEAGSYQHLPLMEDYYLWVRAICGGARLANVDQVLVHARVGNGMAHRRGNRSQIRSRKELNEYMLQHGMITRAESVKNMAYIIGFTCCPDWVREFVYNKLLRR